VQNYRNAPCVNLLQCAIDDHDGTREITYFENVPGADHMIGVASFYDTQWKSMYPNAWKTETVPCRTLASVLTQFGMEDANIYQIDTEGHDYHIIKQIDFFMHLEKDFFLVSEHFWDSSTAEFDIQKNNLLEQLTNMGFYIETIYGRRSGNKTGIQISRLCE
jgi:FkbM family methyltransferase